MGLLDDGWLLSMDGVGVEGECGVERSGEWSERDKKKKYKKIQAYF
jgi:hypothetical protein